MKNKIALLTDIAANNTEWDKISPDVICNRFDLMGNKDIKTIIKYKMDNVTKRIPCMIKGNTAFIGAYLMRMSYQEAKTVSGFIFENWSSVRRIQWSCVLIPDCPKLKLHNYFHIDLPKDIESLENRVSGKGRQNIRRKIRLINENIGKVGFFEYEIQSPGLFGIVEEYFNFKLKTHHRNYYMTAKEYIDNFNVTNAYVLKAGTQILSIILVCEQGDIAYLENLTYNIDFSKYSPGLILYDRVLKRLIEKGKKGIFLSGGDLDYKKRYGGIEEWVADFTLYRKNIWGGIERIKDVVIANVKNIYLKLSVEKREKIMKILKGKSLLKKKE